MPNRLEQLAVADELKLYAVHALPPVHSLLRRPMGCMGEAITLSALRLLMQQGIIVPQDLPCSQSRLENIICRNTERALLPARWFAAIGKNTVPDDPTTASALTARIIRDKCGCNPDQYLKQAGFLNGQYRPAFHPDGSTFAAGLGMTAADAARFIAKMMQLKILSPEELPIGKYGMAAVQLQENKVAVSAGWFPDRDTLLDEITTLAENNLPLEQTDSSVFQNDGQSPKFAGKSFLPRARRRFPSVRELAGGAGSLNGTGGEIAQLSFQLDNGKAVICCIEEDGRSVLNFGFDGWITTRCPSGIYAGKAISMDDRHFCGQIINLDGISRTEIRLEWTQGGLLLETNPESETDEAFSLLFAEVEA